MKNKKIVLSVVIVALITLISMALFFANEKNKNDEYVKAIVKEAFSDNEATRNNAKEKLALLAKNGNPTAQYRYGEILSRENDMKNSLYFIELASEAGVLKSTELLGILYLKSKKNEEQLKGFNLLNQTAEKGLSLSQGYLGGCLQNGRCSLPKNEYLAFYWLSLAAENGETDAGFRLKIGKIKEVEISSQRTKEETQKVICEIAPSSKDCIR
ncbi:hypothetical protein ACR30L_13910 [Psychromonas sp. PT13]|uniref:hypothetical protein n=1 Tax=Psychromonas sp. PT13 TaxID=3439547 RepID=UPI003EB87CAF